MGVSAITSSKEDTVGGRSEQVYGERGSGGPVKNAGVSSSVRALNHKAGVLGSSEGMPTECSPADEFDSDEEVFKRAKSARKDGPGRPGRAGRVPGSKEAPSAAAGRVDRKARPAVGRRVRVFWDGEDAWFEGTVDHMDEANALMYVVYDDGDEAWEAYRNVAWSYVDGEGFVGNAFGAQRGSSEGMPTECSPADAFDGDEEVFKRAKSVRKTSRAGPKAAAVATGRKRKALVGVGEDVRTQIGMNTATTTPRHAKAAAVSGAGNSPAGNTPNGASLPSVASAPKLRAKRNKRLQALIGAHRRQSDVESPQPGNIANHARRAMETAKTTPDSGPRNQGTEKGPVAKTAMAKRTDTIPKPPAAKSLAAAPKPASKSRLRPAGRPATKRVTLGDMHDLSSYPSDDEGDPPTREQNDVTFTPRDAGDDADIFALDALNDAIVRAVDSQSTLANKISYQKLSLLKLEMKHALEEAHNSAKNKLSEVTHTSRVNCTNAINTLNSKISEMEMFMQQQQVTFNSMQQQCQVLRETAEHTIQSSERKIHSLHDAEMGSLEKLHEALYDTYTDGVAYIKNYSERMTVGGPGKVRISAR